MPAYNQEMNIIVNDSASDKIVEINSRLREMKSLVHDINRNSSNIVSLFGANGFGEGTNKPARFAVKNDRSRAAAAKADKKNSSLQKADALDKELGSVSKAFIGVLSATALVTRAFQRVTGDAEKAAQALGKAASSAKMLGLNTSSTQDAAYASDRRIKQLENQSKNAMATSTMAMAFNEIKENFFPGLEATLFGDSSTEFRYNAADMENAINSGVGNMISSGLSRQNALAIAQNLAGVAVGAYGSDRFGADPTAFTQALMSAAMGNADAVGQYGLYADENTFTGWMADRGYDIANVQYSEAFLTEQRYAMLLDEINTIMSDPTGQMTVDSLAKGFRQMGMEIQNCKQQLYGFDEVINQTGLVTDDVTVRDAGWRPSTTITEGLDAGMLYNEINDATEEFMNKISGTAKTSGEQMYKTFDDFADKVYLELEDGIDGIRTYLVQTENGFKIVITNDMGEVIQQSNTMNNLLTESGELTDEAKDKLTTMYKQLGYSASDAGTACKTASDSLIQHFKDNYTELKSWLEAQTVAQTMALTGEKASIASAVSGIPEWGLNHVKSGSAGNSSNFLEKIGKSLGTTIGALGYTVAAPLLAPITGKGIGDAWGTAVDQFDNIWNDNKYADGGLFTSEVRGATIGEAGREAVLPLDSQLGIDALSAALEQAGAGQNITVNLNAGSIIDTSSKTRKELAQMVADEINYLSSKRGGLLK